MHESLISLQEKASTFFREYEKKYKDQMQCSSGCSHCCIGELSIFSWEAELIIQWFLSLNIQAQLDLKKEWAIETNHNFTNVEGEKKQPCTFLVENKCSIYPRRPIICRTQGMGLKWQEDKVLKTDSCPLNFTKNSSSNVEDMLNLDVLNQMIAQAQKLFSSKMSLSQQTLQNSSQRVDLAELKIFLTQI